MLVDYHSATNNQRANGTSENGHSRASGLVLRLVVTTAMGSMAAVVPSFALAQSYATDPNFAINDSTTVYDGIGTVTPLPGGTSVLERVLYSIEQINTASPDAIAPVNGVYANIAESVMNREWYTTDRVEVAYEDYVEDVITPQVQNLNWANISSPPSGSDFTESALITDPNNPSNTATLEDMEFMTISVFAGNTNVMSSVAYQGTNSYTFSEYAALTASGSIDLQTPYDVMGADLQLLENGDVSLTGGSQGFLIVVVEVAGQSYLLDTISDSGSYTGMTVLDAGGWPYELSQLSSVPFVSGGSINLSSDLVGTSNTITYPFSTTIADSTVGWVDADSDPATPDVLEFRPASFFTDNGLSVATYDYDVVVPTDFTRQLDSFFEDWNQRDVATVINGSVTNVITGVNTATEEATASAASSAQVALTLIDIGDITTTALGAVNTGNITIGVNSAVDEAASTTTRAIQASLAVIGGSAETGTMMLNIAHNTSIIRGNVDNTLIAVNGSVGDISTTALGAVNTGTITNGVNAAVQGIVGLSGVN